MPLSTLINRPCTITRRSESGTTDEFGNDISKEETVETVYELQQRPAEDRETDDELAQAQLVAFFLPGTQLGSGDNVTDGLDGLQREVVGEPWQARNPRTKEPSHVEATLTRVAAAGDGQ